MSDSLDLPRGQALGRLPAAVQTAILCGAVVRGQRRLLPRAFREPLARELERSGLTGAAVQVYVIRRVRFALGYGLMPTPPSLTAGERAFIDQRAQQIIARLDPGHDRKAA